MESPANSVRSKDPPRRGGRFLWREVAAWLAAAPGLGVLVAWAAVVAQEYFAPLILFPVLVGVGLGALAVGLIRIVPLGNRLTAVLGTILAASVAIGGQHYFSYITAVEATDQQDDMLRIVRRAFPDLVGQRMADSPRSVFDFLHKQADAGRPIGAAGRRLQGGWVWASWGFDGLLVLSAALAMVVPAVWLPYCDRCRSWYRVIRSGRIPGRAAVRLASLVDLEMDPPPRGVHYRLLACVGGCGPTAFELSWEAAAGDTLAARMWLGPADRDRVTAALDEEV